MLNTIQESNVYRANYFLSFLCVVFPLVGILLLWNKIYSDTSLVGGYNKTLMITYFILATLIGELVAPCIWREISIDIKDGGLSKHLLKPLQYHWYNFSIYMGDKVPYSLAGFIVIGILVFIFKSSFYFQTNLCNLILFFLAVSLGIFLGWQISYLLSLTSFWLEDNSGLFGITNVGFAILMGSLLPLDLFPRIVSNIAFFLPFPYLLYFPVKIYLGKIPLDEIVYHIGFQFMWILILLLVNRIVWRKGIRKYSAVGG